MCRRREAVVIYRRDVTTIGTLILGGLQTHLSVSISVLRRSPASPLTPLVCYHARLKTAADALRALSSATVKDASEDAGVDTLRGLG